MIPVDFETANTTFGKPKNMTDEQCSSLKAEIGIDNSGFPYILTAWMPNMDDLESIKIGNPVYIKMITQSLCPIAVFTTNSEGLINED